MWSDDAPNFVSQLALVAGDGAGTGPVQSTTTGNMWGGALQQLGALGMGYLSRRADVDIQQRIQRTGGANVRGDQAPITTPVGANVTQAAQVPAQSFLMRPLSAALPISPLLLLIVGAGLYLAFKR